MKSKYKFQTYTQTARAIEKDVHILIPAKQTSKRRQVLHQTEIQNILAFQLSSNKPRITFLPECSICKLWSKFFFFCKVPTNSKKCYIILLYYKRKCCIQIWFLLAYTYFAFECLELFVLLSQSKACSSLPASWIEINSPTFEN